MRSSVSQLFRSAYALLPADSLRPCYITIPRRFPLHSAECYFVPNTPAPCKPRASALSTRLHPSLFWILCSAPFIADRWLVIHTPRNYDRVAAPQYNHIPSSRFWLGRTADNILLGWCDFWKILIGFLLSNGHWIGETMGLAWGCITWGPQHLGTIVQSFSKIALGSIQTI